MLGRQKRSDFFNISPFQCDDKPRFLNSFSNTFSRYKDNREILKSGMSSLGFKELVPEKFAGHIITCFYYPKHHNFSFQNFYQRLSDIGKN